MRNQVKHFYEFGPFRLDTERPRLSKDGEAVHLSPKTIEALIVLVQNAGRTLERNDLMRALWSDNFVEDANLTVIISSLRKVLNQTGDSGEYIETIPRVGYRFVAVVHEGTEEIVPLIVEKHTISRTLIEEELVSEEEGRPSGTPQAHRWSLANSLTRSFRRPLVRVLALLSALIIGLGGTLYFRRLVTTDTLASHRTNDLPIRSIAVLPPRPIGNSPDNESLSFGMADALITRLGSIRKLTVRPTSSIIRFVGQSPDPAEVGRSLGVDGVLEGSLQQENGRVRVTLRIVSSANGRQLWYGNFDEAETNIFKLQDSVSQQVAAVLFSDLSKLEIAHINQTQTIKPEAYAAYLKGNYFWSKRGWEADKSKGYYRKAIELDPSFAEAYVGLATIDAIDTMPSPEAEALIDKALQLDDSLADAHATKGFIAMFHYWNWNEAERELDRAIELNPNSVSAHHWKGIYFSLLRRLDEAKAELHKALELDPTSLIVTADLGQVHYFAREYEQATDYCNRVLELDPTFEIVQYYLYDIYRAQGMEREAITHLAQGETSSQSPDRRQSLIELYQRKGLREELQMKIDDYVDARGSTPKSDSAKVVQWYLALGSNEKAVHELKHFLDRPNFLQPYLNVDPIYDPIRNQPEFRSLLQRMNFQ